MPEASRALQAVDMVSPQKTALDGSTPGVRSTFVLWAQSLCLGAALSVFLVAGATLVLGSWMASREVYRQGELLKYDAYSIEASISSLPIAPPVTALAPSGSILSPVAGDCREGGCVRMSMSSLRALRPSDLPAALPEKYDGHPLITAKGLASRMASSAFTKLPSPGDTYVEAPVELYFRLGEYEMVDYVSPSGGVFDGPRWENELPRFTPLKSAHYLARAMAAQQVSAGHLDVAASLVTRDLACVMTMSRSGRDAITALLAGIFVKSDLEDLRDILALSGDRAGAVKVNSVLGRASRRPTSAPLASSMEESVDGVLAMSVSPGIKYEMLAALQASNYWSLWGQMSANSVARMKRRVREALPSTPGDRKLQSLYLSEARLTSGPWRRMWNIAGSVWERRSMLRH